MLTEILQELAEEIKEKEADWLDRLKKGFSYEEIEHEILDLGSDLFAKLAGSLLEEVPGDEEILKKVRQFGGKLAYRFVGYQEVTLRLGNGRSLKVRSPYFVKAKPKRGRKKRGPNGRGCHVLLELLGFMGHCSVLFISEVVQMALLCPSSTLFRKFYRSGAVWAKSHINCGMAIYWSVYVRNFFP